MLGEFAYLLAVGVADPAEHVELVPDRRRLDVGVVTSV